METEKERTLASLDGFFSKAQEFKKALGQVKTFNDVHKLWQETSLPYDLGKVLPYSSEYREIQLEIYKRLSGDGYAVTKEMTSTKMSSEQFEQGYPWSSKNLGIIGSHFGKVAQALTAIASVQGSKNLLNVIEFGSGWGELSIPLAKAGQRVTCVDIDSGFIERVKRIANRENCEISTITADFVDSAESISSNDFDCVVFQSSFHHCLEFDRLLTAIKKNVLNESGVIFFFAEPIVKNYPFPWGLRYDGESLWAIMCNSWLELGFDYDFFSDLVLRKGFFLTTVPAMGSLIGDGYMAVSCEGGLKLRNWLIPDSYRDTWHLGSDADGVCFSKRSSTLPGLAGTTLAHKRYNLTAHNYSLSPMTVSVTAGAECYQFELPASMSGIATDLQFAADCALVTIEVPTFVPDQTIKNGDLRELGIAVSSVRAN